MSRRVHLPIAKASVGPSTPPIDARAGISSATDPYPDAPQQSRWQGAGAEAGGHIAAEKSGHFGADTRGRRLRDLRISVTDRCNFRCGYCMPKEVFGPGFRFLPKPEILSFEEITRIAGIFVAHGVTKLRLTGGEPLLRAELYKLVEMLAAFDVDLALTTNGSLLAKHAASLARAGLGRVTVSLDSLDDVTFRRMNDVDFPVSSVLDGIDAARSAGLPVKVNSVVRRGFNDAGLVELAEHFRGSGTVVRFIEFMDVGSSNGWDPQNVTSGAEIVARISERHALEPVGRVRRGEVATRYRYLDGSGEIGVITSVSKPFCGDCSRARLSADGKLYTCLFARTGHDLATLVRSGAPDSELSTAVSEIWAMRSDRYSELRGKDEQQRPKIEMSYIGG